MSASYSEFLYPISQGITRVQKKDGSPVKEIRFRVNDRNKAPIMVLFSEKYITVDDYFIEFKTREDEVLFLQDLYFVLEEVNEVPSEARITNGQKIITAEQIFEEAQKDVEKQTKES